MRERHLVLRSTSVSEVCCVAFDVVVTEMTRRRRSGCRVSGNSGGSALALLVVRL